MNTFRNFVLAVCILCHLVQNLSAASEVMMPPSITVESQPTVVYREGSMTTLPCVAVGAPHPTFTWTKNGSPWDFSGDSNINLPQADEGTITFTSTSASDEGYYQCFATNIYGTAMSLTTFLQRTWIGSPPSNPSIIPYPVTQGDPVEVICQPITSVPTAVYSWAISNGIGDQNPSAFPMTKRYNLDPFGNLYFANTIPSDSLNGSNSYSCIHRNPDLATTVGGSYSQIAVTPATAQNTNPAIQYKTPSPALGLVGNSVTLYCIFSGFPTPTITWTKQGGSLPADRSQQLASDTQLYITELQLSDAGTYQCQGSNVLGPNTAQTTLNVDAIPVFQLPSDGPENVNTTVGDDVTVNCDAFGIPSPSDLWLMNGLPMDVTNPPERMTFSSDGKNLTISNVCKTGCPGARPSDLMVVQCNTSNTHGSVFGSGYINVLVRTQITDAPPNQAELKQNNILVLPCNGTSDPSTPPMADWYVNGLPLVYDPPYTQQLADGSLQIDTNNAPDWQTYAGRYTCNVTNGYSSAVDNCQVQILRVSGASVPWWIWLLIVIALIIIILLIICCVHIHKNPGQDYLVDKNERKQGLDPVDDCRNMDHLEFVRPPDVLKPPPQTVLGLSSLESPNKYYTGSDAGSLVDYADTSFGKFNEDGSFIGEYNTRPYVQGLSNPAANVYGSSDWSEV